MMGYQLVKVMWWGRWGDETDRNVPRNTPTEALRKGATLTCSNRRFYLDDLALPHSDKQFATPGPRMLSLGRLAFVFLGVSPLCSRPFSTGLQAGHVYSTDTRHVAKAVQDAATQPRKP